MAFRCHIGGHRLYRHRGGRPGGPGEALRLPAQHRPVSTRPDPARHAGRQPAARTSARRHRRSRALGSHLPAARGWPGGSGLDPHPQAGRRPRRRLAPCRRPLRHVHPRARHPVGILRLPSRPAQLARPHRPRPRRRGQTLGARPPHLASPRRGQADAGHGWASGVAGNERNSHGPRARERSGRRRSGPGSAHRTSPHSTGCWPRSATPGPCLISAAGWDGLGPKRDAANRRSPEPGTEGPGHSLPRIPRVPETRRHRWR